MNSWLWPQLLPNLVDNQNDVRLIGIGSLLRAELSRLSGKKVIFGTGSGYGDLPTKEVSSSWNFYCVRGPLTAQNFNLDTNRAITDAAWLLNLIPEFAHIPAEKSGVSFIPHWTSATYGNWEPVCHLANIGYINPLEDSREVIRRIARSKLVIAESLHGAIIADYFRTPWIPVSSMAEGRVLHFKWLDWCMSIDVPYSSTILPPSDFADFLIQKLRPKRGQIEVQTKAFSQCDFHFRQAEPSGEYNMYHKIKRRLVAKFEIAKNSSIKKMVPIRDFPPLSVWNAVHREQLAHFLKKVAQTYPFLSSDQIRLQRIDQLNSTLDRLKKDYS